MKKISVQIFAFFVCFLFAGAQSQFVALAQESESANTQERTVLWQPVSEDNLKSENRLQLASEDYVVFQLNKTALSKVLSEVSPESIDAVMEYGVIRDNQVIIELPLPDGSLARVRIEESSVMEPELAARFPEIKSYRGQGVDDPALTTRFDWTPLGFHALILTGDNQTVNIQPATKDDDSLYLSINSENNADGKVECLVKNLETDKTHAEHDNALLYAPEAAVGSTLRNYGIAVAADFEYSQTYGNGTNSGTLASINTWINSTNFYYERELSIHLNLVNNTNILYTAQNGYTAATDPYDNSSVSAMLSQVIPDLGNKVGAANYDLGHVLGTPPPGYSGSGVSYVGHVGNNNTFNLGGPIKGGSATQLAGSAGNPSALGVFIHEIGHIFGANHNFNGTQGNCGAGQHNNANSFETGSGSTIMSYSGICASDNITTSRDMRFHPMSYLAINNYIAGFNTGFDATATGNSAPTVSGGGNRYIPKNTPFILSATGSDPNGDALTYSWDEIDAGGASYPQNGTEPSYTDATDPVGTTRPIFRSFAPVSSPSRTFPSLTYILNNANDVPNTNPTTGLKTAEELPRVGRTLNFRVTARDNRAGGGGVNEDTVVLTVDNNSGPFLVTTPNTNATLPGGLSQLVTWSVNNTNAAPISAANVKISLSTDGGNTFPTVLAASTANDGSEIVTLPNVATSTARLKIEAVGNVFFDISDTNFSITNSPVVINYEADVSPRGTGDGAVSSTDVSIIQGFQLGLGLPYQSNEFQRADCAPFETRGDGQISSIDVSQAQAYQLGLNLTAQGTYQPAAGPSNRPAGAGNGFEFETPLSVGKANQTFKQSGFTSPRQVRVVSQTIASAADSSQTVTIPINVDALGDESVYGFGISYDSSLLSNPIITAGTAGGAVMKNTSQAGKIGFSISGFSNNKIVAGNDLNLVNITFTIVKKARIYPVNFTNDPTIMEVASTSPNVMALPTNFVNGSVTFSKRQSAGKITQEK